MKYIDAERLQKEVKRLERAAHKSALDCADSETRKFHEGKAIAYQFVGILIDSLQQEPPINTELCTLIACDVIQATAKRTIEKPQDKDKEEDLMIKKMEYLNMLEKSSFQQKQPEQKKNCAECPHCVDRKDQYGWHFKGCFGGPYKGKFIAEIDECPLKQEQPEVDEADLEKEISHTYHDGSVADTSDMDHNDYESIARHFYELGLNARKEDK